MKRVGVGPSRWTDSQTHLIAVASGRFSKDVIVYLHVKTCSYMKASEMATRARSNQRQASVSVQMFGTVCAAELDNQQELQRVNIFLIC